MKTHLVLLAVLTMAGCGADENPLSEGVVFQASFDEAVRADAGGGELTLRTRFNHETERGQYVHEDGFDPEVFRIVGGGVRGGALEAADVLPRNGRVYFPAEGNLPYDAGGWSGTLSVWLQIDPNTMLKTRFCDPVQITEKGATNGGLWIDFPDTTPRDLRLGAFRSEGEGRERVKEGEPNAPLVVVKDIGWKADEWHHVVLTWENFDAGDAEAAATLYIDGERIGEIPRQAVTMEWDLEKAGIYVAVNYVGLLDELVIWDRALTAEEIGQLNVNRGL